MPLTLTIDTALSDQRWTASPDQPTITLEPGGRAQVPIALEVAPDAWVGQAVRLTVRARDAAGRQVTAALDVAPERDAPAAEPHVAWGLPDALLGGLDAASLALGAAPVVRYDEVAERALHDGVDPWGALGVPVQALPAELTVDLAGDAPVPVVGLVVVPTGGATTWVGVPRDVELQLSDDGATFTTVWSGRLAPVGEQAFTLSSAVPARSARLRVLSTHDGHADRLALGEWRVIAQPGFSVGPAPIDLASTGAGGHIVRMDIQPPPNVGILPWAGAYPAPWPAMLTAGDGERTVLTASADERMRFVLGFHHDRAARITGLRWVDPVGTDPASRLRELTVEVSTMSPLGPWQSLGTWRLRDRDGASRPFALDAPRWARFVRFTATEPGPAPGIELPDAISVLEAPAEETYRSILGAWAGTGPQGPMEWQQTGALPVDEAHPGDDTPTGAVPLDAGFIAEGRVHLDEDVDWLRVHVPDGDQRLMLDVGGTPALGVRAVVHDLAGQPVPTIRQAGDAPGTVRYVASVTGGSDYLVRIEQPPFSAVVLFDTSGSLAAAPLLAAMRSFLADLRPGTGSVLVAPLEDGPLLPDWSDDPYALQNRVVNLGATSASSGVEGAVLDAAGRLSARDGARAILLLTDAETTSSQQAIAMWSRLDQVRPQLFTVLSQGESTPVSDQDVMEDLAAVAGGIAIYAATQGDLDRSFDRMAAWLRRPATYSVRYETAPHPPEPPRPGSIRVVSPMTTQGSPAPVAIGTDVAVAIVLDTSGSMRERVAGVRRLDTAKAVLSDLLGKRLPGGMPVTLRVFRDARGSCDTRSAIPLGPLDATEAVAVVEGLTAGRSVRTPLAKALVAAGADLSGVEGTRVVVLVSDGAETCKGDPAKAVRALRRQGITVQVIGLGLTKKDRKAIAKLAALGGGTYRDAKDTATLTDAFRTVTSAPFDVLDASGRIIASGTVDGDSTAVPPGTYRVVVRSDPPFTFEAVVVEAGGTPALTVPVS